MTINNITSKKVYNIELDSETMLDMGEFIGEVLKFLENKGQLSKTLEQESFGTNKWTGLGYAIARRIAGGFLKNINVEEIPKREAND